MTSSYVLPKAMLGYEEGTPLRDVTLAEARAMECNRCGDCCNGLSDYVKRDPTTDLPLFVWGSRYPNDLYEERFGRRLLMPIVRGDGGPVLGEDFEVMDNGKPYTGFRCSMLQYHAPQSELGCATCTLYGKDNPEDISTIRPRNCGDFPVFGLDVTDSIIAGHPFVPPTGALPRCTWYGIRVVGPLRNNTYWRERWDKQQRDEPVEDLSLNSATVNALSRKTQLQRTTTDGSTRKER